MLAASPRSTALPDAVIVIDNASTDHTPAVLAAVATNPGLQVIRSDDNLGGAGGFHLGVRTAYAGGLRPDLADGRRRGAGARLPDAC